MRFTFIQSLRVVLALGTSDFVLKYRGSILGYLWSFAGPLLKFLVMFHVLRPYMVSQIPHYALYLFLGLILWEFFVLLTSGCVSMPMNKADIIRRIRIPRVLLVLAVGWTSILVFFTHFSVFLIFYIALGMFPGIGAIYFGLVFLQLTFFAIGIGMFLASYALKYQDITHLWSVILQIFFWLTPVAYVHLPEAFGFSDIRGAVNVFIQSHPVSIILFDARNTLLYFGSEGFPSLTHIVFMTAICLLVFIAGFRVFQYRSRFFIQEY
jgi:ABC-type polysaccharide/polyol phosphate export permease